MKPTREQLLKIKATFDHILSKDGFDDYSEELFIDPEDIEELIDMEFEMPEITFPGEQEPFEITAEEFLEIADEITSLEIIDSSKLKTKHFRYYIVDAADAAQHFILKNINNSKINVEPGISLELVSDNFIIGIAATEIGDYESDVWGTASQYLAIQIKYSRDSDILSDDKEMELVKSFIFEIADTTGNVLSFGTISNKATEYEVMVEDAAETHISQLRELEQYNEGMKLFVSAIQIRESELKFLNFYKILEHFAPVAVNIEAYELMRKKLDSPKSNFESGDFIRSIFDLAKSTRDRFNDEDLIQATFSSCFDFIGIFEKLPESIKKKIKKQIGDPILQYSTDKNKITTATNMVGKIIYATRNKVVHAKSNYNSSGNECESSDIPVLNNFMKEASSQAIRWYNRQPKHLKLNIVS